MQGNQAPGTRQFGFRTKNVRWRVWLALARVPDPCLTGRCDHHPSRSPGPKTFLEDTIPWNGCRCRSLSFPRCTKDISQRIFAEARLCLGPPFCMFCSACTARSLRFLEAPWSFAVRPHPSVFRGSDIACTRLLRRPSSAGVSLTGGGRCHLGAGTNLENWRSGPAGNDQAFRQSPWRLAPGPFVPARSPFLRLCGVTDIRCASRHKHAFDKPPGAPQATIGSSMAFQMSIEDQ